jgi:transposase
VSIEQAAALMNVSAKSVKRAKARRRADSEAHERVKRGEPVKASLRESAAST